VKKTAFMEWIDGEIAADPNLARDVEEMLDEMQLEQQLAALRESSGLSQRQLARRLGTSQPYVAKLESGRIKNLGVRTLARAARAMGGSLTIDIRPAVTAPRARKAASVARSSRAGTARRAARSRVTNRRK